MKQILFLISILIVMSCNDGNLDIASFEFEEAVNHCGDTNITLYRLSNNGHKEALIVTLTDEEIRKDTLVVNPIQVTESGLHSVTDRVFDTPVSSNYFCTIIPPIEPKVLKNWKGVSGTILVENEPVIDANDGITITGWKHTIILQDVVLMSGAESLIFKDSYLFGSYETSAN